VRLPRLGSAAAALAFAALAAGTARGGDGAPRPRIALERASHDFGAAKQNAELRAEIRVRNDGDATLHVREVAGGCACMTATISSNEIATGGKATLTIVYRTFSFVGPHPQRARVVSDDPDRPVVEVEVRIDVCAGVVLEPANFFFETAVVGSSPGASLVAKWKEGVGKPFRVLGVESTNPDVAFSTEPWDAPPWHGTKVTMSFPKPPPVGPVTGQARIRTDDPDFALLPAYLGGTISGRVWLSQRVAVFGQVARGAGGTLRLFAKSLDPATSLGTPTVRAREGRVGAAVAPDPAQAGRWVVTLSLPLDAPVGAFEDVVEVRTSVPGEEVVEIRVRGTVVEPPR
jgi:hypothetical protein